MKWLFYVVTILVFISSAAVSAQTQHAFTVYNYQDSFFYDGGYYQESGGTNGFYSMPDLSGSNTNAIVPHLHAGISSPPSIDSSQNRLYFDVDRTVAVPLVSSAWAQPQYLVLGEYSFNVSFDWNASIRSGYRLELQGMSTSPGWVTLWSVIPTATNYSGHVSTEFTGYGTRFVLTAVPEPSTLITLLGGVSGLSSLVWRKRR